MSEAGTTTIVLPIVRVTAYEDRADVVREGTVELAGRQILVLSGLSPLITADRLVATLDGTGEAHVDDVRVERRWVTDRRVDVARQKELEAQVHAAEDQARAAEEAVKRVLERRESFTELASRYALEVVNVVTRTNDVEPAKWESGFTGFEEALAAIVEELTTARLSAVEAAEEADRLDNLLARGRSRGERYVSEVHLAVSGDPGPARLTLSTVVPCALWRPSHEAHLTNGSVAWSLHATVWQTTGEDWDDVALTLSTARPSAGARLPPLEADRLRLREKTDEERKEIRVEHRHEEVPRADLAGAAPGVYDGGEPRELTPEGRVTIPGDGRGHRVAVGSFVSAARVEKVALPELSPHVFHRATLENRAGSPLLAGPVTLLARGGWVGVGDLPYVGEGEELDLSFGSDDRFAVTHRRRRLEEDRKLARDRVHFVTEVDLSYSGTGEEEVTVLLRLPKSELAQLKVVPSAKRCRPWPVESDDHGLVRVPVRLVAGKIETVKLGFHFEKSGKVSVPDPW